MRTARHLPPRGQVPCALRGRCRRGRGCERRQGGETGVAAVTCLEGETVWRARDEGVFSDELARAACAAVEDKVEGAMEERAPKPAVFLIEHRDGLRTACLMLNEYVRHWSYAGRVAGEIRATEFFLQPDGPGASFGYLSRNIQRFFATGQAPYPPERTLLATGIVDAVMNSRYEEHRRVETPGLDFAYVSYAELPMRPAGPRPEGASLDRNAPDLLIEWQS